MISHVLIANLKARSDLINGFSLHILGTIIESLLENVIELK